MSPTPPLFVLAAALSLHWVLHRLGRRAPVVLTRWRQGAGASRPDPTIGRVVHATVLPLTVAVWIAATWALLGSAMSSRSLRDGVVAALDMAFAMPLFTMHDRVYTTRDVLLLPAALVGVWLGGGAVTRRVQSPVLCAFGMARGTAETIASLTRYALTLLGALVVLQVWGFDVRTLAIAGSVLGVGIGFGLQNLANNFVSGLVIGLERPIKPGDYVRVGEFQGTVERIGPRSTQIVTNERLTILVPNARFLEAEVLNWTHRDPTTRLSLPVSVGYDADLLAARRGLVDAAAGHPDVLRTPAPRVELRDFGADGYQLELEFFVRTPRRQHDVLSDVRWAIAAAFRRDRIEIPSPQRELRLSGPLGATLLALGRAQVDADAIAAARAALQPVLAAETPPTPRRLGADELDALLVRMRGAGGVPLGDRRHRLVTYRRCFVGRDAVDWIMRTLGIERDRAIAVGEALVERGGVRHVLGEHGFRDGVFFYRFTADEPPDTTPTPVTASRERTAGDG